MVDGLDVAQHLARASGMSGVSGISGISGVSGNKHSSFSCQLFQAVSVEFLGLEFSKTCFLHFSKFCEKAEVLQLSTAETLTQLGVNEVRTREFPLHGKTDFHPIALQR